MKCRNTFQKTASGFTLIEMMIAMTILAFISVGVYDTTARTFEMRDRLEADSDFYNTVRGSLDQIGRDLGMLYTPQLSALPPSLAQATASNAGAPFDPGTPTAFWGQLLNRANVRPTRLQGEEQKLTFISNSHVRLYRESQESDFAKITYTLEDDVQSSEHEKAFVKHEDPDVFKDDGRDSDTDVRYVILARVKSLKFRYLDGEKDEWFNRWDTDRSETKNKFPALIEVTIEAVPAPPLPVTNTLIIKQVYKPELAI